MTAPAYLRVKEQVLRRIRNGRWRAGDRIPSEHELVREFGVARMTVGRALRELTEEGWLKRAQGVGTFVGGEPRAESHPVEIRNVAEEIAQRGHAHRAEVIRLETVELDETQAAAMERAPGARAFFSEIVHWEGEQTLQLERRWVAPEFAPAYLDQDFTRITPSAHLLQIAPIEAGEQIVRAEIAERGIAKLLGLNVGDPLLVLVRRTWSRGKVVSHAHLFHPAQRFQLVGRFPAETGIRTSR
jgi:GntR family transcriptional regulator, histidine utilization repressor